MGKRETKTRGTVKSVKSENAAPNLLREASSLARWQRCRRPTVFVEMCQFSDGAWKLKQTVMGKVLRAYSSAPEEFCLSRARQMFALLLL